MRVQKRDFIMAVVGIILAAAIPVLLFAGGINSQKNKNLTDEILNLEKDQKKTTEENKKLITDISLLSSSERIEKIAVEELGMRQAETEEIVRVNMADK